MIDPDTAALRARHLLDIGRIDEAKRVLGEAIAQDPENADLHVQMARTLHAADEPAAALDAAERSLALAVTTAGLQLAGASQRALGEYDASLASYDRAIERESDAARLHVGRALTLVAPVLDEEADAERARLSDARQACDTAGRLDPELAVVPYARGLVEMAAGDLPQAARHFERALELDPESALTHRMLGTVRARQGMSRLASRHLAAAGRLDPQDPHTLSLLRRLVRPFSRRARRKGRPDTDRVVPSARRILEADLRLRGSPPTEW